MNWPRDPRRIARLCGLGVVIALLIMCGLTGLLIAEDRVAPRTVWRTKLALLIVIEIAYGACAGLTLVATPVLAVLFTVARRRVILRPIAARGLLLCSALLIAMVVGEVGAALFRERLRREGILTLGAVARAGEESAAARLPGSAAEVVLPSRFPDPPDEALTLVVIGESSAEGVPFNLCGISLGNLVAWKLEESLPHRKVIVVNLAFSGENLERQHRTLATLERRPDVLIVYCGHNEFSSRVPWSRVVDHYHDGVARPRWDVFVDRVERVSPFCGLVREAAETCQIALPPRTLGNRLLIDQPAYTAGESRLLLADFEQRLEAIVAFAEHVGAVPVLIVPAANDSGFEPNRSSLPAETPQAERRVFEREFRAARRLEPSDPAGAIARYQSLLERQPRFAEAHYRLARLLESKGAWEDAYEHAVAARDCDGFPMRMPTAFQDVYRAVAARHATVFIDSQAYFHRLGRHGLLDDGLFVDAMHPSLKGQLALAQAVLQGLHDRGVPRWPGAAPTLVLDPRRCAAHFALGPKGWEHICLWGAMVYDVLARVCHDPSRRLARRDAYQAAFEAIAHGKPPESLGLASIGTPEAIPLIPGAAILTSPGARPVSSSAPRGGGGWR